MINKKIIYLISIIILFFSFKIFANLNIKLPFSSGEKFYLTQGYDTGTHINKDTYALDLSQNGCEAYGKKVVAVADGIIRKVGNLEKTYGFFVDVSHGDFIGRYAHLKEFIVNKDDLVKQGQVLGYIGNTGLKISSGACPEYPGTHLHFRATKILEDGTEVAYKPEPISGYTNLLAGNWYTSDNHLAKIEAPVVSEEKKQGWFSKLWNNLKLVFKKTEQAVDKGDIRVEALTSKSSSGNEVLKNTSFNIVTNQQTELRSTQTSTITTNSINTVPKSAPVLNPPPTNQVSVISGSNKSATTTGTLAITPPTLTPPYPGFGGGGSNSSSVPSIVIGNESNSTNENTESISTSTTETLLSGAPVITSPENHSKFATTTITFQGTSSPNSVVFVENFDELGLTDASGNWQLTLELEQGSSTLNFFSIEDGKSTSTPIIRDVFVDTIPPVISLAIYECQYSLSSNRCVLPVSSTTAIFSTNETASSTLFVDGIIIFETGEIATSTQLILETGVHEIVVTSRDVLGNSATSTLQNIEIFKKPIVINEIAWAGTSESAFNEWIELESQIDEVLDMSRLSIEASDQVLQIALQNQLESYGYYLIERTDDESVPTIPANLITAFSGSGGGSGLSNSGEELLLIYHMGTTTVVIDKTPAVSVCGGWCNAQDNSGGTMMRTNPTINGALQNAWSDDPNTYIPIFNSTSLQIAGTPKAGNYSNPIPQI